MKSAPRCVFVGDKIDPNVSRMAGEDHRTVRAFASLENHTGIGTICFSNSQDVTASLIEADAGDDDKDAFVAIRPHSPVTFDARWVLSGEVWRLQNAKAIFGVVRTFVT